jgi:hypothetical protein
MPRKLKPSTLYVDEIRLCQRILRLLKEDSRVTDSERSEVAVAMNVVVRTLSKAQTIKL